MEQIKQKWEKDGFVLRSACIEDAEQYYLQNFNPLDKEVAYFTGSKKNLLMMKLLTFF